MAGINEGVLWMCGTLILVIFFVLLPPFCKLSYAYGPILATWQEVEGLMQLKLKSYGKLPRDRTDLENP